MLYVIAFFFPWLALMLRGKVISGIFCLILQITIIGWIPAFIWAVLAINNANQDQRTERIVNAIQNKR